jgi:hypothetical protein
VRGVAPAVLLAVLAACEAASLRVPDFAHRLALTAREARGERIPASERTGFFFDPGFAEFLDEVARRTPRSATIAVLVPSIPDGYRYQAAYTLAPRRVVDEARISDADWLAVWGPLHAPVAGGLRIGRDGVLVALPR